MSLVINNIEDTLAFSGIKLNDIVKLIEESVILNNTDPIITDQYQEYNIDNLVTITPTDKIIPQFSLPVCFINPTDKVNSVAIDIRPYTSIDRDNNVIVRDKSAINLMTLDALLTSRWSLDDNRNLNRKKFLQLGEIPGQLFCLWISNNITRRFNLDPEKQLLIAIMCGYYYYCLHFSHEEDLDNDNKLAAIKFASKVSGANFDTTHDVLIGHPKVSNIKEFIEGIKLVSNTVRLNDFNHSMLYMITNGYWYGNDSKLRLAVALEYPPIWISTVLASFNERGYISTPIAKLGKKISNDKINILNGAVDVILSSK